MCLVSYIIRLCYSSFLMIFFLGSKMGPFHQSQKNRMLWNPKRSSFITKKYELQFDTSTSIILGSRFFKTKGYNLRFICEPLYKFLYGILFIVQQQYVAEYYSSITGITHPRDLTRHTSTDAAYICLLYTSPSPRDLSTSRMPSSA